MVGSTWRFTALVAAGGALLAPGDAGAAESRPIPIVSDTATNGVYYRLDLTRVTRPGSPRGGAVTRDVCLRLTFRGTRKKTVLRSRRRCLTDGFEYRSPRLAVSNERDPDSAPLVFGFAAAGLDGVQVLLAGGHPPVGADLRAVPTSYGRSLYVLVARGLDAAPVGVRTIGREGQLLDGVLFPAR
jgi:hypothetical protein